MFQARMRPDFRTALKADGDAVLTLLDARLSAPDAPFRGQVRKPHAFVRPLREQRTMLSPQLNLEVIPGDDGGEILHGVFTPHPNVWTGFMAVFAVLGLLGLAGVMYGFAQMTVDEKPWALLAGPISVALIAFVYGAAFIGQGLSVDEMYALRNYVDRVVCELEPGHDAGS
ncbi:MAG TPA: hypothetical protein P5571_12285 [Candidatus Krumholzibacteria bacterium]|nr:hypothetical protein [Candidatus Krumholzibacteria bacterium]HRX52138.1 hypothetical protein [Candidatus Krumholzibacteria bacterium]